MTFTLLNFAVFFGILERLEFLQWIDLSVKLFTSKAEFDHMLVYVLEEHLRFVIFA